MENASQETAFAPVRVRFAPSPTGFLHIGGVRTALFNWLYARHWGGDFLLRIEDTDLERSEGRFTADILASMRWLGLNWDEEPLYQSQRLDLYMRKALELVSRGKAYRCFCTEAEVEKMREKATADGKKPMYDRRCRDLSADAAKALSETQPWVIRAKVPLEGGVEFTDLIRGPIRVENGEVDDFVLIRSNGAPTYNLSVVVDDAHSKITHIIRGDDHINNTPKQIHLYRFFESQVPHFAHLPMILGSDKKKLSKRHGAVSANAYRAEGYLPEALLNFLARLGWSHGDQELFTMEEMIQHFSFDHCQKSSAVFNVEKLLWLNGAHIRRASPQRLSSIMLEDYADHFAANPGALQRAHSELGSKLVGLIQPKVKTLQEMVEHWAPLCTPGPIEFDVSALKGWKEENLKAASKAAVLQVVTDLSTRTYKAGSSKRRIEEIEAWGASPSLEEAGMNPESIDAYLRQTGEQHGIKLGDLLQPMRLAVTGRMVSVSLFELMSLLPWDLVEARLKKITSL